MNQRATILRQVGEASTHTVNRPLRVPGQRVVTVGAPPKASEMIGRGGQILPRLQVLEAETFEIDVSRFDPPPPPEVNDEEAERAAEEERRAAEVARLIDEAREEGYRAGYEKASTELADGFAEKAAALVEDAKHMHEENTRFAERVEVLLVDLAFRIAETVLDSPLLTPARDAAKDAVANAVERLAGNQLLRVHVHPVDYLRLQEAGLVDQLTAAYDLRWEPDSGLAPGDWSVESPDAVIRRFERELLSDLRERLGLLTRTADDSDAAT